MKLLKQILTLICLFFAGINIATAASTGLPDDSVGQRYFIRLAGNKLQQQIDRNNQLKAAGHKEEMHFVVEVDPGPPFLLDEAVGTYKPFLEEYTTVKEALEVRLQKIYQTTKVEPYLLILNQFDVKILETIKGAYSLDDVFKGNVLDDSLNIQQVKAEHDAVTTGIVNLRRIFTDNSPRLVLSVGIYKGFRLGNTTTFYCTKLKTNPQNEFVDKQIRPLLYSYLTAAGPKKYPTDYPESYVTALEKAIPMAFSKAKILNTFAVDSMVDIIQQFTAIADYDALSVKERLHIFSVLLKEKLRGDYLVNQNGEGIALRVLSSTPARQVDELLGGLEQPSVLIARGDDDDRDALIARLFQQVDDRFIFFGRQNATTMMTILKDLLLKSPTLTERVSSMFRDEEQVDKHLINWRGQVTLDSKPPIGTDEILSVSLDDKGSVEIHARTVKYRPAGWYLGAGLKWEEKPVQPLKPFELVFFSNNTKLSLLDDVTQVQKGQMVLVPAIFLKYADHNALVDGAMTTASVAIDVVSLATGVGEFAAAIGVVRKGIALYEIASSVVSLASTTIPPEMMSPTFRNVLTQTNMVMSMIGGAQMVNGSIRSIPGAIRTARTITGKLSKAAAVNYIAAVMCIQSHLIQLKGSSKAADEIFFLKDVIVAEWKIKGEDLEVLAKGTLVWSEFRMAAIQRVLKKGKDFQLKWINEQLPDELLVQLDGFSDDRLKQLDEDLDHYKYGADLRDMLNSEPNDLDIWLALKEDGAYHFELMATGSHSNDPRWEKWSRREFFKFITGKGKNFEESTVLVILKNRASDRYKELKAKFKADFGKELDEYDLFSQVQLYYDKDAYFIADQLFVKFKKTQKDGVEKLEIEDILVIEDKLSRKTALTDNQAEAIKKSGFSVRSAIQESKYDGINKVKSGDLMTFEGGMAQWYKIYDSDDGTTISGIEMMAPFSKLALP